MPRPGMYTAQELFHERKAAGVSIPWWCLYRMSKRPFTYHARLHLADPGGIVLFNMHDDYCEISGVTFYPPENNLPLAVPKDIEGIVLSKGMRTTHLACPAVPKGAEAVLDAEGLVGYPVHGRCWDLLFAHLVGDSAQNDLKAVLDALRSRYTEEAQPSRDPEDISCWTYEGRHMEHRTPNLEETWRWMMEGGGKAVPVLYGISPTADG